MNISFLILLLSISVVLQAGERLDGISGSVGKSANPFSTLLTKTSKAGANENIKNDAISISSEQEKELVDTIAEIDLNSDIHIELKDAANKLETTGAKSSIKSAHKRPTQLFTEPTNTRHISNEDDTFQATNTNNTPHTPDDIVNLQTNNEDCVKEKVYSLDVDNAAQYEHIEDFPFTYECVIRR